MSAIIAAGKSFNFTKGPAAQWLQSVNDAYYNAGNVGVGTATPAAKLDVNGGVRVAGDATACSSANAGTLRYNATLNRMEYCNSSAWVPVATQSQIAVGTSGLKIANHPSNKTTQLNVTAGEITLGDSSGNRFSASAVSFTVNIAANGVNGLDTGSEANSTWYYVWAIGDGTQVNGLLSLSSTSPTLPSGYTYKLLIGAVYNESTGNLREIAQIGKSVFMSLIDGLASGTQTTAAAVALASQVPPIATAVHGRTACVYVNGTDDHGSCHYGPTTTLMSVTVFGGYWGNNNIIEYGYNDVTVPILTPQTIYYHRTISSGAGTKASFYPKGYDLPGNLN